MTDKDKITFGTALKRGFTGKCPNCGKGKMFPKFLKVAETCPNCGEELYHHRADDMPAYCVIVIVGHLLVPFVLLTLAYYNWPDWVQLAVWVPVFTILSVALLQPVKGAIVALQWFNGMHGFARAKNLRKEQQSANNN